MNRIIPDVAPVPGEGETGASWLTIMRNDNTRLYLSHLNLNKLMDLLSLLDDYI